MHLRDQDIDGLVMGRLSATEQARVEEHLLVCHECQNRLTATDLLVAGLRALEHAQGDT